MRINKQFLDEIEKRLDIVSAAGRSTVEQIMLSAPAGFDFEELYAYVKERYLPVVEACTDNAAAVGASSYSTFREIETGDVFDAIPVSAYDAAATDAAVAAFVTRACNLQDMSVLVDLLGRRLDAETMRSYTNSQLQNGERDPLHPKFARVPSGPNPCAFCRALAGHGFFYTSKEAAGDDGGKFNRFHDFCRCQVVPQFSKRANELKVEGYDPQIYVEEWRQGRKSFGNGHGGYKKAATPGRKPSAMPKIETPVLKETPKAAELPSKVYGGEWDQANDMRTFLKTMFKDDEYVGTCSEFFESNGRRVPTRGLYQRSAGQIENVLDNTHNVSSAVGRYRKADGAYVRINPLDGKGVSDTNVVDFRYTLIECDTLPLEEQYGYIKALNLPTQTIVTSGGKSVHAVVRIDAKNLDEYRERVALLHAECKASGFDVDTSTKNPSRYMRIPGVKRGDGRQVLVSTKEGAGSWDEWRKWCDTHR